MKNSITTKQLLLWLGPIPLAIFAAGCSALTSSSTSDLIAGGSASGVHYCLPKSVMEFRLSANPDTVQFKITAGAPKFIKDTTQCYYMNYRPLPQYDDHIKVELGPRGYLKSVSADTTDKTVEIIKNLARAFGALGYGLESAYLSTSDDSITSDTIDPTNENELKNLRDKFRTALTQYARRKKEALCEAANKSEGLTKEGLPPQEVKKDKDGKAKEKEKEAKNPNVLARIRCEEFTQYATLSDPLSVRFKKFHETSQKTITPKPDCRVGLCYRAPEPWELIVEIGSKQKQIALQSKNDVRFRENVQRSLHLLPNKANLVEIDLERAILVNKLQTITFTDDGMLDTVAVKKQSEFVALSSIPVEVVSAIAEGLKIRVGVLDEQISNTKSSTELIEARAALEKQRAQLEHGIAAAEKEPGVTTASRVPMSETSTAPLAREEAIR